MTTKQGVHQIGPDNGTLTVSTYVGGLGSKMGHDLVLEATSWSGTVKVEAEPQASSAKITIEAKSLEVIKATGGVKPLSDKDKSDIADNQAKTLQLAKHPQITFESTSVTGAPPKLSLLGNVTIAGTTRPVTLDVTVEESAGESRFTGKTAVAQTDFGIKPYSKLGALKVKDQVDIEVRFSLPSA